MTRDAEPTAALAFNMGLCNEMEGDLDAAVDWHGDARRRGLRPATVDEALARIARRRLALGQWVARKSVMDAR